MFSVYHQLKETKMQLHFDHLIGCRSFHGWSASPYKRDMDQSPCLLRKMEKGTTVGCIWYALIFQSDPNKLSVVTNILFLLWYLVFKTAVVFVCKDGSKQKKKMVCFSENIRKTGAILLNHSSSALPVLPSSSQIYRHAADLMKHFAANRFC